MSLARTLFGKSKELCDKWGAVANADWFGHVLTYARADLMEGDLKPGEMEGARKFERILCELAELDAKEPPPLTSGIHHDLDVAPRTKTNESKPEK